MSFELPKKKDPLRHNHDWFKQAMVKALRAGEQEKALQSAFLLGANAVKNRRINNDSY